MSGSVRPSTGIDKINNSKDRPIECRAGRAAPARAAKERIFSKRPPSSAPEIFERRRAQLRVSGRVLDRSMADPVLNAPRVVAGVGQGVAAGVAQHVSVIASPFSIAVISVSPNFYSRTVRL
jgi:hypothetical protein